MGLFVARRPLPTAVKELKGTLQPCRDNPSEPKNLPCLGAPPKYMTSMAKEAWCYAVSNSPKGLLTAIDGTLLERWANCCGMYREVIAKVNAAGVEAFLATTPSGIVRRSPLLEVIRTLADELKGYEIELGFTPASRSRVSVPAAQNENDPWSAIAG